MTKELQKRPYKRKYKCKNPNCKSLTDCPAWFNCKIYCKKCATHRNLYKMLPSKYYINRLKEEGLW